jgi:hypothetical protein
MPTALETLGIRTADKAPLVRGRVFEVLRRFDAIDMNDGGCRAAVEAEARDMTAILAAWILLSDELTALHDDFKPASSATVDHGG